MRFHGTNGVCAIAVLVAACSLEGCGDDKTLHPVEPGLSTSSSSNSSSNGSSGEGGTAGTGGAGGAHGGSGGVGGNGGSSSSGNQGGMGGSGGATSSSSSSSSGLGGMGGMGGQGGGPVDLCGDGMDPSGTTSTVFTIGPSEAIAALCNAETLVGNQTTNKLEVRTATGTVGSSYSLPDKPFDLAHDIATNTAYTTLFNTMATTTDLVRVNLTTGVVKSIPISGVGLRVALGNNGRVFVTMSDAITFPNRPIALVDGTNATLVKTFLIPYGGSLIAFDRASNMLYLADDGASPSKLERYGYDPVGQTLTLLQSRADTGNNGVDLAISPNGQHVAFSCTQGNATNPLDYKLHDINAANLNAEYGIWNTGMYPTAAVFSPDNLRLMATNGSTMRRFTVDTHTVLSENILQPCVDGSVRRIAVSPGGTLTYVLTKCGAPATSGRLARYYYP